VRSDKNLSRDPLHLKVMFGLSEKSSADYAGLARGLTERPIEAEVWVCRIGRRWLVVYCRDMA
jgi:hypothetical protein